MSGAATQTISIYNANPVLASWNIAVVGLSGIEITGGTDIDPGFDVELRTDIDKLNFSKTYYAGSATPHIFINPLKSYGEIAVKTSITMPIMGWDNTPAEDTVTVYNYAKPYANNVSAIRCTSDGTPSETGAYLKVKASFYCSSIGGRNFVSGMVKFKRKSDSSWSSPITLISNHETIIGGGLSSSYPYDVCFTATDTIGLSTDYNADIGYDGATVFLKNGGKAVGIGGKNDEENTLLLKEGWRFLNPSGAVIGGDVIGLSELSSFVYDIESPGMTTFIWYDDYGTHSQYVSYPPPSASGAEGIGIVAVGSQGAEEKSVYLTRGDGTFYSARMRNGSFGNWKTFNYS